MTDAIAAEIRRAIAESLDIQATVQDLRRLAGGTSHETWACRVIGGGRDEDVIVRRDIGEGVLDGDGAVEFTLLGTLHGLGQPVPLQWLRTPGMTIMAQLDGTDIRKAFAAGKVSDPATLGRSIVEIQAGLHTAELYEQVRTIVPPAGGPLAEIERWAQPIEAYRSGPTPLLTAAISWLRANLPPEVPPRLVHTDYKTNNLLLDSGGQVTVIDWELAHAGDVHEDLAWTMLWSSPYDLVGGMLTREEYLSAYMEAAGVTIDGTALFFWELHALVKLASIFVMGLRPGAERMPKLLQLQRSTPWLERRIAERLSDGLASGRA